MENTLENKKKFLSLYYDVACIQNDDWIYRSMDKFKDLPFGYDLSGCYASLKSISLITDEDALKLAKVFDYEKEFDVINTIKEWCLSIINDKRNVFSGYHSQYIHAYQLIISKGYALPYMGLSVETQIEYGWIRLNH